MKLARLDDGGEKKEEGAAEKKKVTSLGAAKTSACFGRVSSGSIVPPDEGTNHSRSS